MRIAEKSRPGTPARTVATRVPQVGVVVDGEPAVAIDIDDELTVRSAVGRPRLI